MTMAISSGLPRRRNGMVRVMIAAISSGLTPGRPPSRVMIGMSVIPGLSTMTRMPRERSSTDNECASERTAALAAVYIEVPMRPFLSASAEPTRMIDASSRV